MGIASKYNKGTTFTFRLPKDFKYCKLEDLVKVNGIDFKYKVNALYINSKSKFGKAGVVATESELVNLPNFLTETIEEMIQDSELVEAVNAGKFGFMIYEYETTTGKHYSVNWIDLD